MKKKFKIIVKRNEGNYIFETSDIEDAISIFREKLEENPENLVVLERIMNNGDSYESLSKAMLVW